MRFTKKPKRRIKIMTLGQYNAPAKLTPRSIPFAVILPRVPVGQIFAGGKTRSKYDAERFLFKQALDGDQLRMIAKMVADKNNASSFLRLADERINTGERMRNRFFDEHVRARMDRGASRRNMQTRRITNNHSVGFFGKG